MGKKQDINQLANVINPFLVIIGFYPRHPFKRMWMNYIYMYFWRYFARINYTFFYVGLLIEMFRLVIQHYSLAIFIISFSIVVTATKITIQLAIYIKNNVLDIYDEITKKEKQVWDEGTKDIQDLYVQKIYTGKLFRMFIGVSTFVTVSCINISGAFGNYALIRYNKAHNASRETHYMYNFWFPGNKLEHLDYVFTINVFMSFGAITYNITTNLITVILCVNASTHLSLLQHRLRNYIPDDLTEDRMQEMILTLKKLVLEHQYLIAYHQDVNSRCNSIIMMEYILTSFDVAAAAVQIIKMDRSELGWLLFYFCLLVITIFCLAWSTNEVFIQSQAVGDAAYESNWYLLNEEGKKLTHFLIHRAQKPLTMTIGPFGPMTMESFLMVMKISYSYVTVMRD